MGHLVKRIEERFVDRGRGFDFNAIGGTSAEPATISVGWWAVLENGAVPCGPTKPDFREGDRVEVTVRKL